jgi:hypothetical protein
LECGAALLSFSETIGAEDRSVSARLEGDAGFLPALGAGGRVELARTRCAPASSAAVRPGTAESSASSAVLLLLGAAGPAALGLVREAQLCEFRLLIGGKREVRSAVDARQKLVRVLAGHNPSPSRKYGSQRFFFLLILFAGRALGR